MKIHSAPSPSFDQRAAGAVPRMLILHYTDTLDAAESLRLMQDPAHKAAAHYLVDEDGNITRLVDENNRAWHAGKSYWAGETDINSLSIGIEVQNPGHTNGYRAYPRPQVDAVAALCRDIFSRHDIPPQNVLGHSDVAPARKQDPDYLFPWKDLAAQGVGLWPEVVLEDSAQTSPPLMPMLTAFGYDPSLPEEVVITAFQRHFEPEVFTNGQQPGRATPRTAGLLQTLLHRIKA